MLLDAVDLAAANLDAVENDLCLLPVLERVR